MAEQKPLLIRILWFLFIGWWATPVVVNFAWVLNVTIIGIPLGIWLIDRVPWVLSLKQPRHAPGDGRGQLPIVLRAFYFVFIGWWVSFIWANVAAFFAITIVGLPIAYIMFDWLPFVTSLYRYHG